MLLNSVVISVKEKKNFSNVYHRIIAAHEKKELEEIESETCLENLLQELDPMVTFAAFLLISLAIALILMIREDARMYFKI